MSLQKKLPKEYCEQIRTILGFDEAQDYFESFSSPPRRALRCNRLKKISTNLKEILKQEKAYESLENVYRISSDFPYGKVLYHDLGAYYIQEPSAMVAVEVLNPHPGEKILDLCAAPGSKSTQIGERMNNEGLLVCNEIVKKRALILSENLKRYGIRNSLILNNNPKTLENVFLNYFDAILVDAPCSGEGMFRKNPEAIEDWSLEHVHSCALRQKEILLSAITMLKSGGRLVYSTCTLNKQENENLIDEICSSGNLEASSFIFQNIEAPKGKLKLWPHKFEGEGHFVALLKKNADQNPENIKKSPIKIESPSKKELDIFGAFCKKNGIHGFTANFKFHSTLLCVPDFELQKGLHVLDFGIRLGEIKNNLFFPDYAFAMAIQDEKVQSITLTKEDAQKYISGLELTNISSKEKGFILLKYDGYPLAWGKIANGVIKNHYPKHLRKNIQL